MPFSVNTRRELNLPLTWEMVGIGNPSGSGGLCSVKHSNTDAAIGLTTPSGILVIPRVEVPVLSSPGPRISF
jgi:hypothetical protein